MKTVCKTVYLFSELSAKAQEKALNSNRGMNIDSDWWEFTYEDFKEKITAAGFNVTRMYFSGFWSQGDGAMFEYDSIDGDLLLKEFVGTLGLSPMRANWLLNIAYCSAKGRQSGHYYHENSCDHSIYLEVNNGDLHWSSRLYKWIESFLGDFEDFLMKKYMNLCRELYTALEEEYEYLTSDEAVGETIEANGLEFNEDGSPA